MSVIDLLLETLPFSIVHVWDEKHPGSE
jgi:hypothetical protein